MGQDLVAPAKYITEPKHVGDTQALSGVPVEQLNRTVSSIYSLLLSCINIYMIKHDVRCSFLLYSNFINLIALLL